MMKFDSKLVKNEIYNFIINYLKESECLCFKEKNDILEFLTRYELHKLRKDWNLSNKSMNSIY